MRDAWRVPFREVTFSVLRNGRDCHESDVAEFLSERPNKRVDMSGRTFRRREAVERQTDNVRIGLHSQLLSLH